MKPVFSAILPLLLVSVYPYQDARAHVGSHNHLDIYFATEYREHMGSDHNFHFLSLESYEIEFPSQDSVDRQKNDINSGARWSTYQELTETIHLMQDSRCGTPENRNNPVTTFFNCSDGLAEYGIARRSNDIYLHQYDSSHKDQSVRFIAEVGHSYWLHCVEKETRPGVNARGYNVPIVHITGKVPLVDPDNPKRTAYYQMTIDTLFNVHEAYYVSCAMPPSQVHNQIISGRFEPKPVFQAIAEADSNLDTSEDNCEESSELIKDLEAIRKLSEDFQSTFSEVQEIQEDIDKDVEYVQSIENRNNEIYSSIADEIKGLTIEMCESVARRPFDSEKVCELVQVNSQTPASPSSEDVNQRPSIPGLQRTVGIELISWGAQLLADTARIVRYPARVRQVLESNKELIDEFDSNRIIMDSKQRHIDENKGRIEMMAREAYYKYTTEVERRDTGTHNYNADLEGIHNPSSILYFIVSQTTNRAEELNDQKICYDQLSN